MNAIRCVISDLDCTLLNQRSEIAKPDLEELKRLQQEGVLVTFATGRHPAYVHKFAKALELTVPVICANGAVVFDPVNRVVLKSWELNPEIVRRLTAQLCQWKVHFALHTAEGLLMTSDNPRRKFLEDYNATMLRKEDQRSVGLLLSEQCDYQNVYKISVHDEGRPHLKAQVTALPEAAGLELFHSGQNLLDITAPGASKGNGLRYLAERFSFDLADVIAFGDNDNDISMIEAAGHGVAMENAVDRLKAAAEFVTLRHDACGVSFALQTHYKGILP